MKTGPLVLLNLVVTVGVVAGAHLALSPGTGGPAAPPPADRGPVPADLARRIDGLEGEVGELRGALDRLRAELEEERARSGEEAAALRTEVAAERERADAAEALLEGAGSPEGTAAGTKPEMDAFAKEVSKAMRQGIRQEFRRIADLVTAPTPEALEQRRNQIRMFATAFGTNAGLDQAQIAAFEDILNDTDERAREELRPLLQGVDDYTKVDYTKVRTVTRDSFAAQNARIEQEFPRDKADRLKTQIEPIRNLFGAMIDELEKQGAAEK